MPRTSLPILLSQYYGGMSIHRYVLPERVNAEFKIICFLPLQYIDMPKIHADLELQESVHID